LLPGFVHDAHPPDQFLEQFSRRKWEIDWQLSLVILFGLRYPCCKSTGKRASAFQRTEVKRTLPRQCSTGFRTLTITRTAGSLVHRRIDPRN
jgi:hypothetical protein